VIAGGALLLGLCAAAVLAARRARGREGDGPAALRAAAFGLLLFLLVLAPSSSLVPLIDPLAEHRVYLACLGLFLGGAALAAAALRRALPARAPLAGAALAVALSAACGIATWSRSGVWSSSLALWEDTAAKSPGKARVQLNLGFALASAGRYAEAIRAYQRAAMLLGDHTIGGESIFLDVVEAYLALGQVEAARSQVSLQLRAKPDDPLALALLAAVEYGAGRDHDAERAARSALELDPATGEASKYLGMARLRRGDAAGAIAAFAPVEHVRVVDPVLFAAMAEARERIGDVAAACEHYDTAAGQPGNRAASARALAARRRLGCP